MATAAKSFPSGRSVLLKVGTLKEGHLLKRQRGQRSNADLTKLKFQQRYICLNQDYLHYHTADKLKKVSHNHRHGFVVE